jgi:hypothetical protein
MGLSYGWQKFHEAIHSLTGSRGLDDRIIYAIASSLTAIKADEDLPKDLIQDFKQFMGFVTSVPATGNEGTIAATVHSLSEIDKGKVVDKIISMHDTVCKAYGKLK